MKSNLITRGVTIVVGATFLLSAMTLEDYLNQVRARNPLFKATELSVEASTASLNSGEIELSPVLNAGYTLSKDKSLPSMMSSEREIEQYTLGVAKKFITGTAVEVKSSLTNYDNPGATIPGFAQYTSGILGVSVKQSLWRDFFGAGTRAKVERARKTSEMELTQAKLQNQLILVDAENTYWDYVFAQEDLKLKKANLERAQKLNSWMNKRIENGIAESSEGYNSQALKAIRDLELAQAQNQIKNQEVKLREVMGLKSNEATPELKAVVKSENSTISLMQQKKRVAKAEAVAAYLDAQSKYFQAEETLDQFRPDLNLFGTYNMTSYNAEQDQAFKDMTKTDYPQTVIGVNFSWMFDTSAKAGLAKATKARAEAAKWIARKKLRDGEIEWQNYVRDYEVLKQNLKVTEQIAEFQKKRADAENKNLSRGRTVTANVITSETESAAAQQNLLKTQIGIRKMESGSRLFVDTADYLKNVEAIY